MKKNRKNGGEHFPVRPSLNPLFTTHAPVTKHRGESHLTKWGGDIVTCPQTTLPTFRSNLGIPMSETKMVYL